MTEPTNNEQYRLKISDLTPATGLTDQFDDILLQLCDIASDDLSNSVSGVNPGFCQHLRHAIDADTVYLCNRDTLNVIASSATDRATQSSEDTQDLHNALISMVSDLWNCTAPLCPPDIRVFAQQPHFSYVVIPLGADPDHLLVVVNTDIDKSLFGDYLATAISLVYKYFAHNNRLRPGRDNCEMFLLDGLKERYRVCSAALTQRRFELYRQQLKNSAVQYDGLSNTFTSDTSPLSATLSTGLYNTARCWNEDFIRLLDVHYLTESAYGYKTLCDCENLLSFDTARLLELHVHAQSLDDVEFCSTLQELLEKSLIHSTRLALRVLPGSGVATAQTIQQLNARFGIQVEPSQSTERIHTEYNVAEEFDLTQISCASHTVKTNKA